MGDLAALRLLKELRRRRVFRVAGLYVVAVWLLMQAADILFPAWGIPDAAIRFLLWAGLLGFPVALGFGWVFDISAQGIRRTQPVASDAELLHSLPLRRTDYLILCAFLLVVGAIVYDTIGRVMETAVHEEWRPSRTEIEPHSVAVLPFTDLSPERDQEFFTDGMSEEILNRLSAFRELKVIARTSSFAFKDSNYDIGRISALLGVRYLLQGSVRRDGQQLRIATQLVDAHGVQLWSASFDRAHGDIFALQDEIAEAVAGRIAPQIAPPAPRSHEPDLEAYQEYLIGRDLMARRVPGSTQVALERFTRAIEIDPQFAEPYAERALGRTFESSFSGDAAAELDLAQQDIDTALTLNPDLARTYAVKGLLYWHLDPASPAEPEAMLRRALELEPNLADAWYWLYWPLSQQGRHDEAEVALQQAARLEPLGPAASLLAGHEASRGNSAEAERRLLRLLEVPQPSGPVFQALMSLYEETGRLVEAVELSKRYMISLATHSGRAMGHFRLVRLYGRLGLWTNAEYWQDRWERDWADRPQLRLYRSWNLGPATGSFDPAEAAAQFQSTLQASGADVNALQREHVAIYGILRALAGDYHDAIETLEFFADAETPIESPFAGDLDFDTLHALAWAWLQTDAKAKADGLLRELDDHFRAVEGEWHGSYYFFDYARNTVLSGDHARALELLDRAAEAGWRGYYSIRRDPRWDAVRSNPKFQAILSTVKADIEAQRAELEAIEAEDDFIARLDATIALQAAESGPP